MNEFFEALKEHPQISKVDFERSSVRRDGQTVTWKIWFHAKTDAPARAIRARSEQPGAAAERQAQQYRPDALVRHWNHVADGLHEDMPPAAEIQAKAGGENPTYQNLYFEITHPLIHENQWKQLKNAADEYQIRQDHPKRGWIRD